MKTMLGTLTERLSRRGIQACPCCRGTEFFGGHVGFDHTTGSRGHYFDLVICKGCGRTEMFVDDPPEQWVARRAEDHEFIEFQTRDPVAGPFR